VSTDEVVGRLVAKINSQRLGSGDGRWRLIRGTDGRGD